MPPKTGNETKYVLESMNSSQISGDGPFTQKCHQWFTAYLNCKKALLTTSCTHALEMAAILINIRHGDEVIMPSYTFVSTANAFALRGANIVFVDIRPDTMNLDENKIEAAITDKTKAIVPVHYAGVSCDMDSIMKTAEKHNLYVIEDAAQGMTSTYKGKPLGTIGHIGAYSFHETKNYTSAGEGGLLILNDQQFIDRAEIIREKGTNRSLFFRGMVDKYSWVDIGSSYLMNDVSAAYLWGQLECVDKILKYRLKCWNFYHENLKELESKDFIVRPTVSSGCIQNGHMYYIKVSDLSTRTVLLDKFRKAGILAVFHYVPLHSSQAGKRLGFMHNSDIHTTSESEKIIRLPLYYGISKEEQTNVLNVLLEYYEKTQ